MAFTISPEEFLESPGTATPAFPAFRVSPADFLRNEATPADVEAIIRSTASEEGVDPDLAVNVARQESGFKQSARSRTRLGESAIGVMQLMPGTAKDLGVDPEDLHGNIRGGVRYLKTQLERFGGDVPHALAAYNAGPERVVGGEEHNLPQETQDYVKAITGKTIIGAGQASAFKISPEEFLAADAPAAQDHQATSAPSLPPPVIPGYGPAPGLPAPPKVEVPGRMTLTPVARPGGPVTRVPQQTSGLSPEILTEEPVAPATSQEAAIKQRLGAERIVPLDVAHQVKVTAPEPKEVTPLGPLEAPVEAYKEFRDIIWGAIDAPPPKNADTFTAIMDGLTRVAASLTTPESIALWLAGVGAAKAIPALIKSATFTRWVAGQPKIAKAIDMVSAGAVPGTFGTVQSVQGARKMYEAAQMPPGPERTEAWTEALASLGLGAIGLRAGVRAGAAKGELYPVGEIPAGGPRRRTRFQTAITEAQKLGAAGEPLAAQVWAEQAQRIGIEGARKILGESPTFELGGKTVRIDPLGQGEGGRFQYALVDVATGKRITYGTGESVRAYLEHRGVPRGEPAPQETAASLDQQYSDVVAERAEAQSDLDRRTWLQDAPAARLEAERAKLQALLDAAAVRGQETLDPTELWSAQRELGLINDRLAGKPVPPDTYAQAAVKDADARISEIQKKRAQLGREGTQLPQAERPVRTATEQPTPSAPAPPATPVSLPAGTAPGAAEVAAGVPTPAPAAPPQEAALYQKAVDLARSSQAPVTAATLWKQLRIPRHQGVAFLERMRNEGVLPQLPGAPQAEVPTPQPAGAPPAVGPTGVPPSAGPFAETIGAKPTVSPPSTPSSLPEATAPAAGAPAATEEIPQRFTDPAVGTYEFLRLQDANTVRYRFTSNAGKTREAVMPLKMWRTAAKPLVATATAGQAPAPVEPTPPPVAPGVGAEAPAMPSGPTVEEGTPSGESTKEEPEKVTAPEAEPAKPPLMYREALYAFAAKPSQRTFEDVILQANLSGLSREDVRQHLIDGGVPAESAGLAKWFPASSATAPAAAPQAAPEAVVAPERDEKMPGVPGGPAGAGTPAEPTVETHAAGPAEPVVASGVPVAEGAAAGESTKGQAAQPGAPVELSPEDIEKPQKYDYASTQVNLTGPVAKALKAAGQRIPDKDLFVEGGAGYGGESASDGREKEPHITVKYGLHAEDPDTVAKLRELLASQQPISVRFGKASFFPNGESKAGDVLKVDVDSADLGRLNKLIADAFPHTDTHPDYKPHATIAYLKPGLGGKYAGKPVPGVSGKQVTLDRVVFSGRDGEKVEIALGGKPQSKAPKIPTIAPGTLPLPAKGDASVPADLLTGAARAAGLDKLIERDIAPALKAGGKTAFDLVRGLVHMVAPRTGVGTEILDRIYKLKGDREKAQFLFEAAIEHAKSVTSDKADREVVKRVAAEREDLTSLGLTPLQAFQVDFIDRIKTGKRQATPELDALAELWHKLDDQIYEQVKQERDTLPYLENHARVLWKVIPGRAETEKKGFLGPTRRPLQGSKGYLKQHKLADMTEGIKLGGVPYTYSPFDMLAKHYADAMKFVTARRWLRDAKEHDEIEFVPLGSRPIEGFTRINDPIAEVYFPAEMTIKEAFDKQMRERLEDLADSLGIEHQRKVSIGGQRLGYAQKGTGKVVTKFGTPDSVLAHEIGHQFEWKYKISDLLKGREYPERTKELRALADLRFEGTEASEAFRKYVRGKDEKIANAIAALVYAPEKFKQTAPNTWDFLRDELWAKPELRPLFDAKPSMVLGTAEATVSAGGLIHAGHYYADAGLARLMNNWLSRDLLREEGTALGAAGRIMLGSKNFYTSIELGLSGFHFSAISAEAAASSVGLGLLKLWNRLVRLGDWRAALEAIDDLARGLTVAPAARRYYRLGKQAEHYLKSQASPEAARAFLATREGEQFLDTVPNAPELLDDMFRGGAKLNVYDDYKLNSIRSFRQAVNEQNWLGAGVRALGAANEALLMPLFDYYVPRIKVGAFLREFSNELIERGPEIAAGALSRGQLARQVWDFVEDRFGEMNFDNLFWNRTFKTALQIVLRSPTWRLGTIRGSAKGAGGQALEIARALRERRLPRLTREFAWMLGVAVVTAVIGTVFGYLMTRRFPETVLDVFHPRVDPRDPDERMNVPGYWKDWEHMKRSVFGYATSGISGPVGRAIEVGKNRTYYNEKLWDADDPTAMAVLRGLQHILKPTNIAIESAVKIHGEGGGPLQWAPSFFGFTKASSLLMESEAEQRMHELGYQPEPKDRNQAERSREMKVIIHLVRAGKDAQAVEAGIKAVESGVLTLEQVDRAIERATTPPLESGFKRLPLDRQLKVLAVASPEERERLLPLLADSIDSRFDKLPAGEQRDVEQQMEKMGLLPGAR